MDVKNYTEELLIAAEQRTEEKAYWLNKLAGELVKGSFPADAAGGTQPRMESSRFTIEGPLFERLEAISGGADEGVFMLLLCGLYILLNRRSGSTDLLVGAPVFIPEEEDEEEGTSSEKAGAGESMNSILPLRVTVNGEMTFKELLVLVQGTVEEADENQNYPIEILVHQLGYTYLGNDESGADSFPLFDVALMLENIHHRRHLDRVPLNMIFAFNYTEDCLEGDIQFNVASYEMATIDGLMDQFLFVLNQVLFNPDSILGDIEILSEADKKQLLVEFNTLPRLYPLDTTLPMFFEKQVQRVPENTAVYTKPKGDIPAEGSDEFLPREMTYRQLDIAANRLANYLVKQGLPANRRIGIYIEPSVELLVGILAVVKAGCAYVPLNFSAPPARTRYILDDCGLRLVLASRQTISPKTGKLEERRCIYVDDYANYAAESVAPVDTPPSPDDLGYIIYTSGSTGRPKGVAVTHRQVSPLFHWGIEYLSMETGDRVIQHMSSFFDWSVWELFSTLSTGAALYMATEDEFFNPKALGEFIEANQITIMHITPSQCQYLFDGSRQFLSLRYVILGAEKVTGALLARCLKSVGDHCKIFNFYGVTEVAITSTGMEVGHDDGDFVNMADVPIGVPIANSAALVLDENRHLCPVNAVGELYLAGDGVGFGYLNDPLKSSNAFVPNIYKDQGIMGHRLYKTGDRARWLPGGLLQFLGRLDHQVKIRGYRIELGEIRHHLTSHEKVTDALVTAVSMGMDNVQLCAYIVGNEPLDVQELRSLLAESLPDYMVPTYFMQIERIPLTPNGKADLKALPKPEIKREAEYIAPQNEVQKRVAEIWKQLLEVEDVGIDDNFFEIGGNSLNVVQLANMVKEEFQKDVPTVTLFNHPTIRLFSQWLSLGEGGAETPVEAEPPKDRTETVDKGKNRMKQSIKSRRQRRSHE